MYPLNSFLKNCLFYIFIILFVFLIVKVFFIYDVFDEYIFHEWLLINYSQGFVRRGLLGTFFLFIHKKYDISIDFIYHAIRYFSYSTFLVFSSIYIFKVRQAQKILTRENLAVFLFLPSLILFPINDLSMIGRKEFLFFFGLLINLVCLKKTLTILSINSDRENLLQKDRILINAVNHYCYSLFIWYNLLSIPITLTHESIIFFGLPINIMITANLIGSIFSIRQTILRTLIIYFPTILIAILCIIFKGNEAMAIEICRYWQEYDSLSKNWHISCLNLLLKSFISSGESIKTVFLYNISRSQGFRFFCWILAFFLNIVILMRTSSSIIVNTIENLKQKTSQYELSQALSPIDIITSFSFKYAFIPFMCSFIVYWIAIDWGRWFFIITISYTLCLLSPSLIDFEIVNYQRNQWILKFLSPLYLVYSKPIVYLFNQSLCQRFYKIYVLILIYTLFLIRIPHIGISIRHFYSGLLYTLYKVLLGQGHLI
jgi:hypothetical protein